MSYWDYVMPHRFLINKSLRREAEAMRERVDSYQLEIDRRVNEYQIEIEETIKNRQKEFESFIESFEDDMHQYKEYLEEVSKNINTYADAYLQRKCLYKIRSLNKKKMDILHEDYNFLSEQMRLIGDEINHLRKRQDELASFAKVDDIIELSLISGIDNGFESCDDAKILLNKVTIAIEKCDDSQSAERFALIRLKGIIQERSEYLSTIKYITWVIQQKIQYSRKLSEIRSAVQEKQRKVQDILKNTETEINTISTLLEKKAMRIRYFWARPITYLNAEISYAYKEKKYANKQLNDVCEELNIMEKRHINDQRKWKRLKNEQRDLLSEKNSLKESIDSNKEERNQWYEKKKHIFQICEKNDIKLIRENKKKTDEKRIIEARLVELEEIRMVGIEEAEKVCKKERKKIIYNYNLSRKKIKKELDDLDKQINSVVEKCEGAELQIKAVERKIRNIKAGDDRFFFVKIFSHNEELEEAKKMLSTEKNSFRRLLKRKEELLKVRYEKKIGLDELEGQHKKTLAECKPIYLRPTAAESTEEKKLKFRQEEIKKCKEAGYESEN